MFARAAIVGRVARERAEARRSFIEQKAEIKRRVPQLPCRQRCFIPFLRGPCITVGFGLFLILCGAIMCNFAFHAKELAVIKVQDSENSASTLPNDSQDVTTNRTTYLALKSLTFVGPSLMGLGIFVIIIACVLLFDKRDKVIKEFMESLIRHQQDINMELSFRAAESSETEGKHSKHKMRAKRSKSARSCQSSRRASKHSSASSIKSFHNIMQNITEVGTSRLDLAELEQLVENSRSASGDSFLPPEDTGSSELDMNAMAELLETDLQIVPDQPAIGDGVAPIKEKPYILLMPGMDVNQLHQPSRHEANGVSTTEDHQIPVRALSSDTTESSICMEIDIHDAGISNTCQTVYQNQSQNNNQNQAFNPFDCGSVLTEPNLFRGDSGSGSGTQAIEQKDALEIHDSPEMLDQTLSIKSFGDNFSMTDSPILRIVNESSNNSLQSQQGFNSRRSSIVTHCSAYDDSQHKVSDHSDADLCSSDSDQSPESHMDGDQSQASHTDDVTKLETDETIDDKESWPHSDTSLNECGFNAHSTTELDDLDVCTVFPNSLAEVFHDNDSMV